MTKTDKETADAVGCVFGLFWLPCLLVVGYLLRGWVLVYLWQWFVMPLFNVPALNVPQAIGLAIVVGFLTKGGGSDCEKPERDIWGTIIKGTAEILIPPVLVYVIASIVRMWL